MHVHTTALKLLLKLFLIHVFLIFFDEVEKKIPNSQSVTQLTEFKDKVLFLLPRWFFKKYFMSCYTDMPFQLNGMKTSDSFCKKDLSLV